MALILVISTGDFQIRWNVLSLSFKGTESGKWPLGLISETTESTSISSYLDLLFIRDKSNNITTKLYDKT